VSTPSVEATIEVAVATTLTELSERGYSAHFTVDLDGAVCCPVCGVCCPAEHVDADEARPLDDDPDDAALVLALRCGVCRAQGAAVAWNGAQAPPGDAVLLAGFSGRR
jgi:hypothetical protein